MKEKKNPKEKHEWLLLAAILVSFFVLIFVIGQKNNNQDIPEGCTAWFDGCNNCKLVDGGNDQSAACTRKHCDKKDMEKPKCLKFEDDKVDQAGDDSVIPEDCVTWFDGCNTCAVSSDPGGPMACTLMACGEDQMQEPKCLKYKE